MERYRAAYHLHTTNLDTIKVFQSYDDKVVYRLAITASKQTLGKGSCFRNKTAMIDTDTTLFKYLKPVKVSHKIKEE